MVTCKKANNILGFIIGTCYEFKDEAVAKMLYYVYVRSKLEYSATV